MESIQAKHDVITLNVIVFFVYIMLMGLTALEWRFELSCVPYVEQVYQCLSIMTFIAFLQIQFLLV